MPTRPLRRAALALAALALAALALGAPAATAASPWGAPATLSLPGERAEPWALALAVSPSGDAVVAWAVAAGDDESVRVRAATRDSRGAWGPPRDVSAPVQGAPIPLQAVIGPGGDAAVGWRHGQGFFSVAVRPGSTGAWSAPQDVAGPSAGDPALAIEPSGALLAVWSPAGGIVAATRAVGSGTWRGAQVIAGPGALFGSLAASARGTTAVWWSSTLIGQPVQVALRPPGGAFAPAGELSAPRQHAPPALAIGPRDEIVAMRPQAPGPDLSGPPGMEAAFRPPGGAFGPFAAIPSRGRADGTPQVAIGGRGDAVAAWTEDASRPPRQTILPNAVVAERPAGGPWGPARPVRPRSEETGAHDLAVGGSGAAVVALSRLHGSRAGIEAVVRERGERRFGSPEPVTRVVSASSLLRTRARAAVDDDDVASVAYIVDGRVRVAERARRAPGTVRLSAAQLLVNQRISQAALRRASAIEARLAAGLTGEDIRPGALRAEAFAPGVEVAGAETGAVVPAPARRRLAVPPPRRAGAGTVRLSAAQLLVNQRIAQAAVRRANRLAELLAGNLTGAHVADGAIGPEHLAPGLSIAAARAGAAPAPPAAPAPAAGRGGGRVTLSAAQLRINQRISQAAVRRLDAVRAELERGLRGRAFRPGSIAAEDLAPALRG